MIRNLTVGYVTETNEDGLEFAVLATFRCAFSENHNFLLGVQNYIKSIEPMFPTKQIIALHREDCENEIFIDDIDDFHKSVTNF